MPPTRNPWPLGIILAFAIFLVGTASLVVMACAQKSDLVSRDYYEQEIRFQNQIDQRNRAERLPAKAAITYDPAVRRITVTLPKEHTGRGILGRVQLYRPSAVGLDREVKLQPDWRGLQTLDASKLRLGLWKVRVLWTVGGQEYFLEQSVVIVAKTP